MTNKEIAQEVIKKHQDTFQVRHQQWAELYDRYENKPRGGSITNETESQVYLGGAFSLVEQLVARMFAKTPRFKYLARERRDTKSAELYNKFTEYQWDINGADDVIEEIARWGAITGLAGYKIGWHKEAGKENNE